MNIGELINELEQQDQNARVIFDFGGMFPTTIDSWRGVYAEAALGFDGGDYGDRGEVTAKSLINELKKSIGQSFTGWKGGDYIFDELTLIHIDNPGCWTETEITKVTGDKYKVIIHTEHNDSLF